MGMARNATHQQEASRNDPWLIYTRSPTSPAHPRISPSPWEVVPSPAGARLLKQGTNHLVLSQSKQARPRAGHHGAGRDSSSSGEKLLRCHSSRFPTPQSQKNPS